MEHPLRLKQTFYPFTVNYHSRLVSHWSRKSIRRDTNTILTSKGKKIPDFATCLPCATERISRLVFRDTSQHLVLHIDVKHVRYFAMLVNLWKDYLQHFRLTCCRSFETRYQQDSDHATWRVYTTPLNPVGLLCANRYGAVEVC